MGQIDFSKKTKEAEREYRKNANAVAGRLQTPKKRITRQVRMSASNAQKLKVQAAEEEIAMSELLDEIIEGYLNPKKEVSAE